MAKGWMSKDPSEMTARQQRRMQFLEKRGRGGQVSGQPTEMPEMTARQKRRQQYVQRRDARRQRAVEDYRAQQQAQQMGQQLGALPGQNSTLPPGSFRSDNPQDPNIYSRLSDGSIVGTLMGYPGMSAGGPTFNEMKMLDTGNTFNAAYQMTPEQAEQARTMFAGGLGGQSYDKMLRLPPGQTQEQTVGAAMQEPMRTPTPELVNAMPGQLRTGTFTPQGMYRPLPYNATPQQIRERQALIQGGHYFNQLTPAQRMR
jgi:hypothetical protein